MGEKNIIAIALSFSLLWHIVGGEAVRIIWPQQLVQRNYAAINFWGSLVDTHSLEAKDINPEVKTQAETIGPVLDKPRQADKEFNVLAKEALPVAELSEKKEPDIAIEPAAADKYAVSESIQGDLKRSVLVKPALPEYPEWAKELGNYFEVELKFLILADGTIGTVEKVTSAGYPELDEIGIRYIRKWKFMPLTEGPKDSEQWGVVKLVFNLK